MRQVALDTETTGLSTKDGDRVVEIGCVEIVNRNITGKVFHSYCNPERLVGNATLAITGITDNFLQDKPKFSEIVLDFLQFIDGAELIIHNAAFDVEFINNELKLITHNILDLATKFKIVDTLLLARKKHPGQRNNLDALIKRYDIENIDRSVHGALVDANILAKIYLKMTAGQISLNLNEAQKSEDLINNNKLILGHKLKVIYANSEELTLHQEYFHEKH